jgi:hypothetical protein
LAQIPTAAVAEAVIGSPCGRPAIDSRAISPRLWPVNCLKDLIAKFFWNENDGRRFKLAHIRSYLWEEAFMRSFLIAALAAAGLTMAVTSGVYAAPIAPIGKAAQAIDSRVDITYYRYYHRHHHRRCWWHHGHRHCRW